MLVFSRKSTSKGNSAIGRRVQGGGLRMNRTMRLSTKGKGMKEDFYEEISKIEDKTKSFSPELVKKFESVKIKGSKPKSYITF